MAIPVLYRSSTVPVPYNMVPVQYCTIPYRTVTVLYMFTWYGKVPYRTVPYGTLVPGTVLYRSTQGCRNPGIYFSNPGDSWDIPGYPEILGQILIPEEFYVCLYGWQLFDRRGTVRRW